MKLQADVNRLKFCASVEGSLSLESPAGVGVTEVDLPHLRSISGDLTLSAAELGVLRVTALESIGGSLSAGGLDKAQSLEAPRLKSVGGGLTIGLTSFSQLDLSRLETVGKDLQLIYLNYANSLSVQSIRAVGGSVTVTGLPLVRWSTLKHLSTLGTSRSIGEVGCMVCPNNADNRYMCSTAAGC